ncbi:T9SS type A sorting domain-containing protein [candidate division WOR-3 bacterium]|nr:T9SS type A sorting domain-containing protein [candidate division WOR-3 bacterium]
MKNKMCTSLTVVTVFLLLCNVLNAQAVLDDDTLFIGSATGTANEQVIIPVFLSTTHNIQGWQIPIRFGGGTTPAYCDSVSTVGTVMENWVFQAPLTNNNEWNNIQACGIAGLKDWTGGAIDPGYHHVMDLYFTINANPQAGTYVLDTTRTSWYQGGPIIAYMITVGNVSYITHVVSGELTITPFGIREGSDDQACGLQVYPTVARVGEQIKVRYSATKPLAMCVYDATGRIVARFTADPGAYTAFKTNGLCSGVYFVTTDEIGLRSATKIILY